MDYEPFLLSSIQNITGKTVTPQQSLITSRLIDSITLVDLLIAIEEHSKINLNPQDLTPEQFDTVEKINVFLNSKKS